MKKRVLSVLLILLALSACTQQPTQPQTVTTTQPLSGWQQIDGQTVYLDAGIRRTGWQDIDGRHCYFDESGYLQTGWTEIDGKNYGRYFMRSAFEGIFIPVGDEIHKSMGFAD